MSGLRKRPTRSASLAALVLFLLPTVCLTIGCAKSRMMNDPFKKTGRQSFPDDPRYELDAQRGAGSVEGAFDKANAKAREKDSAMDDSGRPVELLPAQEGRDRDPPYMPVSRSANKSGTSQDDPINSSDIDSIRDRLDAVGAQNVRFDRDDATGQTVFQCEVPYPEDAGLFRVFEAKSSDERKAMLAVTEQVEKWTSGSKK